jgi:hypothetical protein
MPKEEVKKPTLKETLDSITFRNDQVEVIDGVTSGNKSMKERYGNNKRRNIVNKVPGLQTLKSTLGKQFGSGQNVVND